MAIFVPKYGVDPHSGNGQGSSGGRNAECDLPRETRNGDTHFSTTGPAAWLFRIRARKEAQLCHIEHPMTESRDRFIVGAGVNLVNKAQRQTTRDKIKHNVRPGSTGGEDNNCDTANFVASRLERGYAPRVSQKDTGRRSAID